MGFACFNDGLGEVRLELLEIHELRHLLTPQAAVDMRAAGAMAASTVGSPPSSGPQGCLKAAAAGTGNQT